MEEMYLGLSDADITPSSPMQTVGFGRADELSRGILHPLTAQVSVWQLASEKCCLVTIDHIGFSLQHAGDLRKRIGRELSISPEKVMLCFSHTHSAPNDSLECAYSLFVDDAILQAVREASHLMAPVKAAWGNAYGDIGVNRREDCDVLDRRIGILKVTDADSGELRLLLLRLTAHANVLKEDNYLISPDYFGTVRDLLAEKYHCSIMLTQGASGNIAPRFFTTSCDWTPEHPAPAYYGKTESASALRDMAEEVCRRVDGVISDIHPGDVDTLCMYSVNQQLTADVPTAKRALEIAAEAKKEAHIDGTAWLSEVQKLIKSGVREQKETIELQYFSVSNGCLCGVPNEILCEFALRACKQLSSDLFYLGGYTNGCTGYFPTEEEYDKGGYEVYWSMLVFYIYHGRVSPLNRNSAGELIAAAVRNAPVTEPRKTPTPLGT